MSYSRPETLIFIPCVRCPPWASERPMIVSPGDSSAWYTAVLACAPECGWTFACSAPNRLLARSMASCSATSTHSQPP